MNSVLDSSMKKMTFEEKPGQLYLPGSGDIITAQISGSDIYKKIREGNLVGQFNGCKICKKLLVKIEDDALLKK